MLIKNKLKNLTILGILATLAFSPAFSFAQTVTPGLTAREQARLERLHTLCYNQITMRLNSLNNLNTKIGGLKKLSSSLKSQYENEIQTDTSGLTALKAKCDADTDLTTLISDVKSIYSNFRIYAVFVPQLRLLVASDMMDVTADNLTTLASKLQTRITKKGNPANLTVLLTDMNNKITDAKTQYSNVQSQITPLTPASYPGSNPILKNARSEIKTGAADLRAAVSDAKQIILGLKGLSNKPDTSITSTPSPTP